MDDNQMLVTKRDGGLQEVAFDKILKRLKSLGEKAQVNINYGALCLKVIDQMYDRIPTSEIDNIASQQCASMITTHYDYDKLAGYIAISNHQKNTGGIFVDKIKSFYNIMDNGHRPIVSKQLYEIVCKNSDKIQSIINYDRDFLIDFFGFKTLHRAYFLKYKWCLRKTSRFMDASCISNSRL